MQFLSRDNFLSDAWNILSFSVLSTCIATILTQQVKRNSEIIPKQAQGAVFENGIIFNHITKILLAEKFINVDFLVPFPEFELDLRAEFGAYIEKLGKLWVSLIWQSLVLLDKISEKRLNF